MYKVKHTNITLFTKIIKWKVYTKVIKTQSWMPLVQIPSGPIKVEVSTSAF